MAESDQLTPDSIPHPGFFRATRCTTARIGCTRSASERHTRPEDTVVEHQALPADPAPAPARARHLLASHPARSTMRAISNHTQRGIRHSVLARTGQRQSAAHHAAAPTLCLAPGAMQDGTLLLWD